MASVVDIVNPKSGTWAGREREPCYVVPRAAQPAAQLNAGEEKAKASSAKATGGFRSIRSRGDR